MEILDRERIRKTAYYPAANEIQERLHREVKVTFMSHADHKHWIDYLPIALLGIRSAFKLTLALPNLSIGLNPGSKQPQPHACPMRRHFSILVFKRVPMTSVDVTGQALHFNPIIMVRIKCIHGVGKFLISISVDKATTKALVSDQPVSSSSV